LSISGVMDKDKNIILRTEELCKWFLAGTGWNHGVTRKYLKAVNGVTIDVAEGETLGIVGESGCGKTTFGRTVLKLEEPTSGKIFFEETDITDYSYKEMRKIRQKIQFVFQDPYASLDPRMKIGKCIGEPYTIQKIYTDEKERKAEVLKLMKKCGLSENDYEKYPHEFSGGQRQRIGIARALALNPRLLVCDEPVSALDVSVQAQLINLMMDLQNEYKLTMLFISHDLSVISHVADRIAVMYLGKIVELADKEEIFKNTLHPYTQALMTSVPVIGKQRLLNQQGMKGELPSAVDLPNYCPFYGRCPKQCEGCRKKEAPILREVLPGHFVSCHFL
jgi:oligopeptide/dipeptide ABC transporter ATP-binding protein